eukprot:1143209-Pelagomonas_calceolata.AAC.9
MKARLPCKEQATGFNQGMGLRSWKGCTAWVDEINKKGGQAACGPEEKEKTGTKLVLPLNLVFCT